MGKKLWQTLPTKKSWFYSDPGDRAVSVIACSPHGKERILSNFFLFTASKNWSLVR